MYGFEDGAVEPDVCARHQPQPSDERRAKIGDDVAVKIFQQQHVVLIRIHHQLHASVVDDVLAICDFGIFLRNVAGATQKQAV